MCFFSSGVYQCFEAIGAKTIDLEWVQVHPTGLVKPDDADAKIKFLAAEVQGSMSLFLQQTRAVEAQACLSFASMVLYPVNWLHLSDQALRGVGGIILNAEGHRFCNELGRGGLKRSVACAGV